MTGRTVVFVCLHGAKKSRLAAAFFNSVQPPGWRAVSAGLHPQEAVSVEAVQLVAGTSVAAVLDHASPLPLVAVGPADLVVAIDCDVPDARRWDLTNDAGESMRDEIGVRAGALARELADVQP